MATGRTARDESEGLASHQRDWDELGAIDPYWAILSDPAKRHGGWDLEAFMRTGADEIAQLMATIAPLGLPRGRTSALDFGCGVGRLSQALAVHFESVVGVDISQHMIDQARRLSVGIENCSYVLNETGSLEAFGADRFDLIYSNIVLQHLPSTRLIEGYLLEFVRVLRPGGLIVFRYLSRLPFRHRVQLRPRAYRLVRNMRVPAKVAQGLGLHPITMHGMDRGEVIEIMTACGATIVRVNSGPLGATSIVDQVFYVTK